MCVLECASFMTTTQRGKMTHKLIKICIFEHQKKVSLVNNICWRFLRKTRPWLCDMFLWWAKNVDGSCARHLHGFVICFSGEQHMLTVPAQDTSMALWYVYLVSNVCWQFLRKTPPWLCDMFLWWATYVDGSCARHVHGFVICLSGEQHMLTVPAQDMSILQGRYGFVWARRKELRHIGWLLQQYIRDQRTQKDHNTGCYRRSTAATSRVTVFLRK